MADTTITWSTLKELAPESPLACDPDSAHFLSWAVVSPAVEGGWTSLGRLVPDDGEARTTMATYPEANYWDAACPVALAWYPFNYSEVFQKKGCDSYYLVYTEFGGHVPERRARLVLKNLILTDEEV